MTQDNRIHEIKSALKRAVDATHFAALLAQDARPLRKPEADALNELAITLVRELGLCVEALNLGLETTYEDD